MKDKAARKINFAQYQAALAEIGKKKGVEASAIEAKVSAASPASSGTKVRLGWGRREGGQRLAVETRATSGYVLVTLRPAAVRTTVETHGVYIEGNLRPA